MMLRVQNELTYEKIVAARRSKFTESGRPRMPFSRKIISGQRIFPVSTVFGYFKFFFIFAFQKLISTQLFTAVGSWLLLVSSR